MARPARIICVGNRLVPGDDLGPRVHDLLAGSALPVGVELVDGGLRGLDLLRAVEGAARAVFVDCVEGFAPPGEVVTLARGEVADLADGAWGHDAGLPYLFAMLPLACDGEMPEVTLIGAGHPAEVEAVAARALKEALRP
ncbi:putative hydrogenase maturation protease [Magnetospirillum sp. XM-1]|uniref:hydrogenase maturation protease n=1 Tax=Magnetospirillum sp. XM-1 TaxID=1663591 RepID=UPI00073DC6BD|nr:hydrogenase maturation protease [Magnetospirillum sp. XM-1]CUW39306.1 putative hydrogenase maturation protease [Magnetospirillum sp. XM-1]